MTRMRQLRGVVKPLARDVGGDVAGVIVTGSGSPIVRGRVGRGGIFQAAIPDAGDLVLTIFGMDGRVLRRRIRHGSAARLDIGSIKLRPVEFPPGIFGQAWDPMEECPVIDGHVTLRHEGAVITTVPIDGKGEFTIALTEHTLLLAGTYRLTVDAPGYWPAEQTIHILTDVTSYRIGRVELATKTMT